MDSQGSLKAEEVGGRGKWCQSQSHAMWERPEQLCLSVKMEGGHEPRNMGSLLKLKKVKK